MIRWPTTVPAVLVVLSNSNCPHSTGLRGRWCQLAHGCLQRSAAPFPSVLALTMWLRLRLLSLQAH